MFGTPRRRLMSLIAEGVHARPPARVPDASLAPAAMRGAFARDEQQALRRQRHQQRSSP
jgi:hypothetical protein